MVSRVSLFVAALMVCGSVLAAVPLPTRPALASDLALEGDAGLVAAVADGRLRPVSLASADFDEDGAEDLACGYAGDRMSAVALWRGDIAGILSHDPQARPFAEPARLFASPAAPDLLAAGDFDGDGHADLALAPRGGGALHVLCGDGRGGLGRERSVDLPGAATALVAGEVDTMDGMADLAVAISSPDGPAMLVFESPEGALAAEPERVTLPFEADDLAIGQADGDYPFDVAAAGLGGAAVVRGRTRTQTEARAVETRALAPEAMKVATGAARLLLAKTSAAPADAPVPPGGAVAEIPMTLNSDGIDDFAVLEAGHAAPSFVLSSPRLNFVVSSLADSGANTLRDAITQANMMAGSDSITFTVAGTINLMSPLPGLSDTVSIDATTAPGYAGTPVVELSGAGAGAADGLVVGVPNCVVRGFAINQFSGSGIYVAGDGAVIQSNFVGTNMAGTAALGNGSTGIQVNASNCTIGGSAATRNISSGNGAHGIAPSGGGTLNVVRANFCGTDVTGNAAIPNFGSGVDVNTSTNNTIGGAVVGQGNILSGNFTNGITMFSNADANVAQGNRIGVGASGGAMGNSGEGVRVHLADGNTIASLNVIAYNGGTGVAVLQATSVEIFPSSVHDNGGLGIDLDDDGVTPNDAGDGDAGANNDQNFPIVTSAIVGGGQTAVTYTLNSTPNTNYQIDFYKNASCDPSGNGEGETYIKTVVASTDGSGNASGFTTFAAVPVGSTITATATDPFGNTSEFSVCATVTAVADMSIVVDANPAPVPAGADLTVTYTVRNTGGADAANATLSTNPIPGTEFVSLAAPPGWSCTTPPLGGSGPINCSTPNFVSGGNVTFTLVVHVPSNTPDSTVLPLDASVGTTTQEMNVINNNSASALLTSVEADITVSIADAPDPVAAGTDLTYTLTVTNNGPSDAQSVAVDGSTPAGTTFVSASAPAGWSCTAPAVGAAGAISCSTATLVAGASAPITVVVHVPASVPLGSTIPTSATASTASPDPTPGNDTGTATTAVANVSDLSVTKTGGPDAPLPNDDVTYTITISNAGPSDALNPMVVDDTPPGTTFISVTAPAGWSCTAPAPLTAGTISCTTQSLGVGMGAVFTVVVRVDNVTAPGTVITNTATASSSSADPAPENDSASATVTVGTPPVADLVVVKTATPESPIPGASVTYTITATNNGPGAAADVTISDPLPAGVAFVSATASTGGSCTAPAQGGTGTVSCTWTGPTAAGESRTTTIVVQVAPDAGDQSIISNTATASSATPDSDSSSNQSTAPVTVTVAPGTPVADLTVTVGDVPETVDTGTLVEYAIEITNNGPNAAEAVTLMGSTPLGTRLVSLSASQGTCSGPAPGGTGPFTCDLGEIGPGESATVTLSVNVVASGGTQFEVGFTVASQTNDPVPFNNSTLSGTTDVVAGNDTLLMWDPPLACSNNCLNPPLHLQTTTVPHGKAAPRPAAARDPRNTVIGYNIYRSNDPNVQPTPENFFTSVPPSVTSIVAPTAPGGSFFTVTAAYPNGESSETNAASGGLPEPTITGLTIRGKKLVVAGMDFSDTVQVFVDGIPFKKPAKVGSGNTGILQKGKLLTGQTVQQYLNQQGGVVLISVLNEDTGIGTFLYRR